MLVLGGEEGKGSGMESDDNVCGRNCLYIEAIAFPSLSFVFVSISEIKVDNQHRTLVEMRLGIYCLHITHTDSWLQGKAPTALGRAPNETHFLL